ncbi:hypothetical protein D043_4095B, partial [Vibrio parahaemolyticus EKP-021]
IKMVFRFDRSYCFKNSPSGSSFLIARKAVGAENKASTLYSSHTRQNAPGFGVLTGLPSNSIVVQP